MSSTNKEDLTKELKYVISSANNDDDVDDDDDDGDGEGANRSEIEEGNEANSLTEPLIAENNQNDETDMTNRSSLLVANANNDEIENDYLSMSDDTSARLSYDSTDENEKPAHIAIRWNVFLHNNHIYILLTAIILLIPLGIYSFPKFIASTDSTIHPIPYSPSDKAINRFRDAFGGGNKDGRNDGKGGTGLVMNDPLNPGIILLLEHKNYNSDRSTFIDGSSDLYYTAKNFTFGLQNYLNLHLPIPSSCKNSKKNSNHDSRPSSTLISETQSRIINNNTINQQHQQRSRKLTNDHIIQPTVDITSYYSLQSENLDSLSEELVADKGNVLLLYVQYTIPSCLYSSTTFHSSLSSESNNEHIQHNIQRSYSTSILSSIQFFSQGHVLLKKDTSPHQNESLYNVTVGYTGIVPFQEDLSMSVKKDIRRMHTFILPLSLILLCVALQGHITLMIIPIFSVLCVCCGWSIIMLLLIRFGFVQITQFTPTVMMSLTIGLGLDYTLFLLSRVLTEITILRKQTMHWRRKRRERLESDDYYNQSSFYNDWRNRNGTTTTSEGGMNETVFNSYDSRGNLLQNEEDEQQRQRRMDEEDEAEEMDIQYEAIAIMIQHAGQTVLMSGITLMFTFLGLLLFPIHAIKSVSIGASVCIIFCLFVNLTVVPSLLHSHLGLRLLQWSRPRNGGTAMMMMIKSCISTCRHKYKLWKYNSSRSRWNSSSLHLIDGSTTSNHESTLSEHEGGDNQLPPTGTIYEVDENSEDPYSDENYTSFQDLIFQQEISKDDSIKTIKQSNMSPMFHDYSANGDLSTRLLCRNFPGSDEEMKANSSDVDKSSFWYSFSNHLLHHTKSTIILLIILVFLFPVAMQSRNIKTTLSFESTLPSRSMSMLTFDRLGALFGKGHLSPYQLMFDGLNFDERIDTLDAFGVMQKTIQQIEQISSEENFFQTHCSGIAWSNGAISHTTYEAAKACSTTFSDCPIAKFRELMKLDSMSTTKDGLSTLVTCISTKGSYSDNAIAWLEQTREELHLLQSSGELKNYTVSILGGASVNYDAQQAVHESMGMMIATTFLCVFVVIAIFFGSIVTPLRSVFTIATTLFSVYGLVALVYQKGDDHTISWLTVPMSFSIIVGLALDYDIFLINRTLEFRISGYDHKSSIVAGLCSTGNVITAAGVIMAISFGGLMFSDSPAVYQWSFALTMAVLLDTFIMRSCVVPILLHKTGIFSWFPRSLPHSTRSLETQLFHEHDNHILL